MNPTELACGCLVKADIPEVEAVKMIVLALLEREVADLRRKVLERLLLDLRSLATTPGSPEVDALVEAGDRRSEVLAALIQGMIDRAKRGFDLDDANPRLAEASRELIVRGADALQLELSRGARDALERTASRHLELQVESLLRDRADELRRLVEAWLLTGFWRTEEPQPVQEDREPGGLLAFTLALQATLGVSLAVVVDTWAYQWFNIGSFEAARAARVTTIYADAQIDRRTTKFCTWVHGREINMQRAAAQVRGDLNGTGWPFLDPETARRGNVFHFMTFWRRAALPPYHFGCRTRVRRTRPDQITSQSPAPSSTSTAD